MTANAPINGLKMINWNAAFNASLFRSRSARAETRKQRGAELYDSIVVRSESGEPQHSSDQTSSSSSLPELPAVRMPGELAKGGTMTKAMSYDVNPIYSL